MTGYVAGDGVLIPARVVGVEADYDPPCVVVRVEDPSTFLGHQVVWVPQELVVTADTDTENSK